jgi:hypothetical protein
MGRLNRVLTDRTRARIIWQGLQYRTLSRHRFQRVEISDCGPWTKNGANQKKYLFHLTGNRYKVLTLFSFSHQFGFELCQFLVLRTWRFGCGNTVSATASTSTSNFSGSSGLNGDPSPGFGPKARNPGI